MTPMRNFTALYCLFSLLFVLSSCSEAKQQRPKLDEHVFLVPYYEKGLWGFADTTGTVVIKPKYEVVEPFQAGLAKVQKNYLWGVIDRKGNELVPLIYKSITEFKGGVAVVEKGDESGAINPYGDIIVPIDDYGVSHVSSQRNEIYDFMKIHWYKREKYELIGAMIYMDKYGLYDIKGNEILPVKYDDIIPIGEGYLTAIKGDSVFEIIGKEGKLVSSFPEKKKNVPYNLNFAQYNDGVFVTQGPNKKFGFVDKNLHTVVDFQYEWAGPFYNGLAAVKKNGKVGFINKQNKVVIPFQYDGAEPFEGGAAIVRKGDLYGLINNEGKAMTGIIYSRIKYFQEAYELKRDDKYVTVLFNPKTNWLIESNDYSIRGGFNDGLAKASKEGKYGFIDSTGSVVIPFIYHDVEYYGFKYGLAAVSIEIGKFTERNGVINKQNKYVVKPTYVDAYVLDANLIKAEAIDDKGKRTYWFLDRNGKPRHTAGYDKVESYAKGIFRVTLDGQSTLIDTSMQEFISPAFIPTGYELMERDLQDKYKVFHDRYVRVWSKIYKNGGFIDRKTGRKFFAD